MDLMNNDVGRRLAQSDPRSTTQGVIDVIKGAIDDDGLLALSPITACA